MNTTTLWQSIEAFDFDHPFSEYGFSTRLAKENGWPRNFTEQAILEYKKFMYLAAAAESMVSPSAIVDIVWHQHLIFTKSYQDFCAILGKKIQHVPSTHDAKDRERFKLAKDRTTILYRNTFGDQPKAIWEYADVYAPLGLPKSKRRIGDVLALSILAFFVSLPLAYVALKYAYTHIDNPYFLLGYIALAGAALLGLGYYNRKQLSGLLQGWEKHAFVFDLSPMELVYLRTGKLAEVAHGYVNHLIAAGEIVVGPDNKLLPHPSEAPKTAEEHVIMEMLKAGKQLYYPQLLKLLLQKPVFTRVSGAMDGLKKYFAKSRFYMRLFILNFSVLAAVLLLGFTRLLTGIARDKPVEALVVVLILSVIVIVFFLYGLSNQLPRETIPNLYRTESIAYRPSFAQWDWQFFFLGAAVYAAQFSPLVRYVEQKGGGGDPAGSCGSSCGSCGSSCGGCGGGGD